jgi:hypothetical protein
VLIVIVTLPVLILLFIQESRLWREEVRGYCEECLQTMRGFVPKDIFVMSKEELAAAGLSRALVSRVWSKKCLWLIRMSDEAIMNTHISDLTQKYNPQGAGLDIVETAAIFARMPSKFTNDDGTGRKAQWLATLQMKLKQLMKEEKEGVLSASLRRHAAYKGQEAVFGHEQGVFEAGEAVSSEGAFAPRTSFSSIGRGAGGGGGGFEGTHEKAGSVDDPVTISNGPVRSKADSERASLGPSFSSLRSQISDKLLSSSPKPPPGSPPSIFSEAELETGQSAFGNPQDLASTWRWMDRDVLKSTA